MLLYCIYVEPIAKSFLTTITLSMLPYVKPVLITSTSLKIYLFATDVNTNAGLSLVRLHTTQSIGAAF